MCLTFCFSQGCSSTRTYVNEFQRLAPIRLGHSVIGSIYAKKLMKAERDTAHDTRRGTLLLRMAISRTLAKHRDHHPEGSLPSSLTKGTSIIKKLKERLLASQGSCPLLQFS